jgi:hypothetical protein
MNELTLDGKTYVSSKRAAEITGYAKDYVGQLCREGHVEARLVGRNWYVLESSIREHRFGKGESEESGAEVAVESWSNPKYIPEEPSPLPVFSPEERAAYEADRDTRMEETRQHGAILSDMESAWREWFTKKQEEVPAKEEVQAEPIQEEVVEEVFEEPVALTYREESAAEEEVPEEAAAEPEEIRATEAVLDLAHREEPELELVEEVIEERRPAPRRRLRISSLVLKSGFIAVAVISIAIAAVGTGYASKVIGTNLYRLSEINFLAGVSEINR